MPLAAFSEQALRADAYRLHALLYRGLLPGRSWPCTAHVCAGTWVAGWAGQGLAAAALAGAGWVAGGLAGACAAGWVTRWIGVCARVCQGACLCMQHFRGKTTTGPYETKRKHALLAATWEVEA